jgi:hypothetical protein
MGTSRRSWTRRTAGPAAASGQGRCLDAAVPGSVVPLLAGQASGEDRGFAAVTGDELPASGRTYLSRPTQYPD